MPPARVTDPPARVMELDSIRSTVPTVAYPNHPTGPSFGGYPPVPIQPAPLHPSGQLRNPKNRFGHPGSGTYDQPMPGYGMGDNVRMPPGQPFRQHSGPVHLQPPRHPSNMSAAPFLTDTISPLTSPSMSHSQMAHPHMMPHGMMPPQPGPFGPPIIDPIYRMYGPHDMGPQGMPFVDMTNGMQQPIRRGLEHRGAANRRSSMTSNPANKLYNPYKGDRPDQSERFNQMPNAKKGGCNSFSGSYNRGRKFSTSRYASNHFERDDGSRPYNGYINERPNYGFHGRINETVVKDKEHGCDAQYIGPTNDTVRKVYVTNVPSDVSEKELLAVFQPEVNVSRVELKMSPGSDLVLHAFVHVSSPGEARKCLPNANKFDLRNRTLFVSVPYCYYKLPDVPFSAQEPQRNNRPLALATTDNVESGETFDHPQYSPQDARSGQSWKSRQQREGHSTTQGSPQARKPKRHDSLDNLVKSPHGNQGANGKIEDTSQLQFAKKQSSDNQFEAAKKEPSDNQLKAAEAQPSDNQSEGAKVQPSDNQLDVSKIQPSENQFETAEMKPSRQLTNSQHSLEHVTEPSERKKDDPNVGQDTKDITVTGEKAEEAMTRAPSLNIVADSAATVPHVSEVTKAAAEILEVSASSLHTNFNTDGLKIDPCVDSEPTTTSSAPMIEQPSSIAAFSPPTEKPKGMEDITKAKDFQADLNNAKPRAQDETSSDDEQKNDLSFHSAQEAQDEPVTSTNEGTAPPILKDNASSSKPIEGEGRGAQAKTTPSDSNATTSQAGKRLGAPQTQSLNPFAKPFTKPIKAQKQKERQAKKKEKKKEKTKVDKRVAPTSDPRNVSITKASVEQSNSNGNAKSKELALETLAKHIREASEPFDAVMIGWGVRGLPQFSWLLEACCEAVISKAPKTTKFLFSATPSDHLETIYRRYPQAKPVSK